MWRLPGYRNVTRGRWILAGQATDRAHVPLAASARSSLFESATLRSGPVDTAAGMLHTVPLLVAHRLLTAQEADFGLVLATLIECGPRASRAAYARRRASRVTLNTASTTSRFPWAPVLLPAPRPTLGKAGPHSNAGSVPGLLISPGYLPTGEGPSSESCSSRCARTASSHGPRKSRL